MYKTKIIILLAFACSSALIFARVGSTQARQGKTAAEVYKNIQVLKDMPADQLDPTMSLFSGSLGVKCDFCHVNPWDKDAKEEKQTAREMIRMTLAINKENFEGKNVISCATCHQGHAHPSPMPPLGQSLWAKPDGQSGSNSQPRKDALPTIDQVMDKYVNAAGGKAAIEKYSAKSIKAVVTDARGESVPVEVSFKAPDKLLTVVTYQKGPVTSGYNGTRAWNKSGKETGDMDSIDADQFKRDAQFFVPTQIRAIYKDMAVVGTDKINGKPVYLVRAVTAAGGRERLYFDRETGLLVRRFATAPLPTGSYPTQVDYDDYRAVDGVKVPFSITWSTPGQTRSWKISEVKQNVTIEDSRFDPPVK
jgi:photosynthetic reaction center cytochrome c subunit